MWRLELRLVDDSMLASGIRVGLQAVCWLS